MKYIEIFSNKKSFSILTIISLLVFAEGVIFFQWRVSDPIFFRLISFGLLAIHSAVASFFVFDLRYTSKRANKSFWFFLLCVVPFLSAVIYCITMQRYKVSNGYGYPHLFNLYY